ncbi:sulfate/molybdate ABC transporter ATP-binding protein [Acetobacter sp. DsW_063]|uniref:sulfate/molybdate ABC transporter ATP-binding protein n=1 Tax=Acetobacter sp. DsW_063 TaxID=1514894 RepID=UPI000A3B344C|nr:sulfate/molybdate ABC transporter ATP-binding protein [Acetobacter sp. DsW_063]
MSVLIENLARHVAGGKLVLDDVSLHVPDGAFVALVGPSGAGKTTLLRAIAGLDPASSGHVEIDGRAMEGLPPRERNVGFVFQNYALFRHLTVARNISFGLDVRPRTSRPSRAEIDAKVAELLALIQLPDLGDAYPQRLSGGQRQRVALARALATGPRLLLLDEPFGALDPMVRRAVRTWLRDLHDQLGLTTILVTHDQEEALDVADRLVVMQDGRIVQDADGETLDATPATPFVMEFLGETLRFPGVVSDGLFIPADAHVSPFSTNAAEGATEALIRPHEVTLRADAAGGAAKRVGRRGPLERLAVSLGERSVEIERPVEAPPSGPVALEIAQARLFQNGKPAVEGNHPWSDASAVLADVVPEPV